MKFCVYTVLTGDYEHINEQPMIAKSSVPFILLTDKKDIPDSHGWNVRHVNTIFDTDPIRSQRDIKIRPHLYIDDFDFSIYIDNSVILTDTPENIMNKFFLGEEKKIVIPHHSYRETVLDEFLEVSNLNYDDQSTIFTQLNGYFLTYYDVMYEKPYWTGIIIRNHRDRDVRLMQEIWAAHVFHYSRRDQLSVNVAFRKAGLVPYVLKIDNFRSDFHSWPHATGRASRSDTLLSSVSLVPAMARIRWLELELSRKKAFNKAKGFRKIKKETLRIASQLKNIIKPISASGRAGVIKTSSGKSIYVDSSDKRAASLADKNGNLNPYSLKIWQRLLSEGGWTHLLDIGSNYGEMLINVDLPSTIKATAVEPNPKIRFYLEKSLSEAGLSVRVFPGAVSDHSGESRFIIDKAWSGTSHLLKDGDIETKEAISVPTATLSDLLLEGKEEDVSHMRAIIKIDVEGAELKILSSGLDIMKKLGGFACLVECLHMSVEDISWISDNFHVEFYEKDSDKFVSIEELGSMTIYSMIHDERFYNQDFILRPKSVQ